MNCFALKDTETRLYEDGDAGTRDHNQAELFSADQADQLCEPQHEIVPIIPHRAGYRAAGRRRS